MALRTNRVAALGAAALAAALVAAPTVTRARDRSQPVEATELTAAGDLPPTYVEGPVAIPPKGQTALRPTITCRLLIDDRGKVVRATIYRRRRELAAFEKAALAAASASKFLPARRARQTLASWINWPVSFAAASHEDQAHDRARLRIKGSETIGSTLGPALVRAFRQENPHVEVTLEAKGSSTAFAGLLDGTADLGQSSRPVNERELAQAKLAGMVLHELVLGYDGIAVVVHPDNPVEELTVREVARLFTGEATDWADVSGQSGPVHPFGRTVRSGTRTFFRDQILRGDDPKRKDDYAATVRALERNEDVVEAVAKDRFAVAYVGLGFVRPNVRAIALSSAPGQPAYRPVPRTVADGLYPASRALLFYVAGQPDGAVARFLHFALSPHGQRLVAEHGFVPSDTPLAAGPR